MLMDDERLGEALRAAVHPEKVMKEEEHEQQKLVLTEEKLLAHIASTTSAEVDVIALTDPYDV